MGGSDEQVAALRQVLLAGGLDREAEDPEQQEPGEQPDEPVEERRPRLRRAAEPGEALDRAAAGIGEGLRRRRPAGRWRWGRTALDRRTCQVDARSGLSSPVSTSGPSRGRRPRGRRRRPRPRRPPGSPSSSAQKASSSSSASGRRPLRQRSAAVRLAAGPCRYHRPPSPTRMNPTETIWAVGIPKNVQLPRPQVSRTNRVSPVPDEEDQEQVAGHEPGRPPPSEPDEDERPDQPGQRLVEEQRVEVGRRHGKAVPQG